MIEIILITFQDQLINALFNVLDTENTLLYTVTQNLLTNNIFLIGYKGRSYR